MPIWLFLALIWPLISPPPILNRHWAYGGRLMGGFERFFLKNGFLECRNVRVKSIWKHSGGGGHFAGIPMVADRRG